MRVSVEEAESKICRSKIRAPLMATWAGSMPIASMPAKSSTPTPSMNSIAITRLVENASTV